MAKGKGKGPQGPYSELIDCYAVCFVSVYVEMYWWSGAKASHLTFHLDSAV